MAKYIVKTGYLAIGDKNVYRGSEVELNPSNPGTAVLLEKGAIEPVRAPKPKPEPEEQEDGSD